MAKKLLIGLGVVILFLLLTNPTESEFRKYAMYDNDVTGANTARTSNFLMFSIYECNYTTVKRYWKERERGYNDVETEHHRTYLGIAKNFFSIR